MTQLYMLPEAVPLQDQIKLLQDVVDPSLQPIFDSPDLVIVNGNLPENEILPLQIESVRNLQVEVLRAPLIHSRRLVLILDIHTASAPAQHAVLKLLEEPPAHIQVILTTTQLAGVLETIQSRSHIVTINPTSEMKQADTGLSAEIEEVLAQFPAKKLTYTQIFKISEQQKDKVSALKWLQNLTTYLHHQLEQSPSAAKVQQLQLALTSSAQLEKNINVRLVIEEFLFQFAEQADP